MAALDIDEMIKNIADKCMDEYEYKHKSLREWIDILTTQKDDAWILVADQLPKNGVDVLFCDLDMAIRMGYHNDSFARTHFVERGSWDIYKNVTSWRPLPEPYDWRKQ